MNKKEKRLYFPMMGKYWHELHWTDRFELILVYLVLIFGSLAMTMFIYWGVRTAQLYE